MSGLRQLPERSRAIAGQAAPIVLGCAVVAAGLLAYGNSLFGPFVFDDQVSILGNDSIRRLADALRPPHGQGLTVEGRPVLNLSFAVNYALGGTQVWSYHAANLAIHLLAGLALFGIVRRTAGPSRIGGAFFVSALWTVHPLQTEAVTYISQRAESLMGLFYLLTLYCFIRYVSAATGQKVWAGLSVLSCLLGMATKEVMVSAPVIVLLYDRTFVAGSFRDAWKRRRGYYLILAATWLVLAGLVAGTGGNRGGSVGFGTGSSWTAYALTQFTAMVRYLRLVFWPYPLVFDYGTFWINRPETVLPEGLAVLGLLGASIWALRFRPALGFLGFGFFAILAPTSLLPGTRQMIVEHRMYLPLAAVLVPVVFAAESAAGQRRGLFCAAAAALAAVAIILTRERNSQYRTELKLWTDTVVRRPGNAIARNNLGNALKLAGRLTEAMAQYQAALRIEPGNAELHNNLGGALHQIGQIKEAIAELQTAVRIAPDFFEAHENLGRAWEEIGQPVKAASEFATALRIRPGDAETHNNLGLVLQRLGRSPEAIAEYEAAVRLRPAYSEARNNLGNALDQTGRIDDAIAEYREALRLRRDYAEAGNNLGNALDQVGRVGEAIAAYQAALRFAPDNAQIHFNLGLEFERAGRAADAGAQFEAALRIAPDYSPARLQLERLGAIP